MAAKGRSTTADFGTKIAVAVASPNPEAAWLDGKLRPGPQPAGTVTLWSDRQGRSRSTRGLMTWELIASELAVPRTMATSATIRFFFSIHPTMGAPTTSKIQREDSASPINAMIEELAIELTDLKTSSSNQIQSLGVTNTSTSRCSSGVVGPCPYVNRTSGGKLARIDSMRPPVLSPKIVPRS